ncbi:MAG: HIT domain-containing protein [Acidobacteriaceae bacterium]
MDRLYTPWRYEFISAPKPEGCVFCAKLAIDDREALIVHRGKECYICLNTFPYNNGHVMVVPNAHLDSLALLPAASAHEMMDLAQRTEAVLRAIYQPGGINMGLNLGDAAGAGIVDHLHFHVVPRWRGDANFMTVVSETRVLPEELGATWQRLRDGFAQLGAGAGD